MSKASKAVDQWFFMFRVSLMLNLSPSLSILDQLNLSWCKPFHSQTRVSRAQCPRAWVKYTKYTEYTTDWIILARFKVSNWFWVSRLIGASEMLGGSNDKRAAKGLVGSVTGSTRTPKQGKAARPAAAAGRLEWKWNEMDEAWWSTLKISENQWNHWNRLVCNNCNNLEIWYVACLCMCHTKTNIENHWRSVATSTGCTSAGASLAAADDGTPGEIQGGFRYLSNSFLSKASTANLEASFLSFLFFPFHELSIWPNPKHSISEPATGSPEISRNSSSSSNKCLRFSDLFASKILKSVEHCWAFESTVPSHHHAFIFTIVRILEHLCTKSGLTCRCYFLPGISFHLFQTKYIMFTYFSNLSIWIYYLNQECNKHRPPEQKKHRAEIAEYYGQSPFGVQHNAEQSTTRLTRRGTAIWLFMTLMGSIAHLRYF